MASDCDIFYRNGDCMHGGGVHSTELMLLSLLAFVAIFGAIAQKLQRPYPIVLVIAGLLLSFSPRVPKITLNPDVIFLVVLPPLLYSAAWLTSWREFRYNLVSIFMLAVGLVAATTFGIARTVHWVIPDFTWQLGFVLGAVVSTTDAIAATSIAKRVGLPQRIVDVLEGESLVNDASGLVALEFGLAMVVRSQTPTVLDAVSRLAYLAVVGIAVGLIIGKVVDLLERFIDDGPIEIAVSILVPYVSYLAAEAAHASGVLAVVACGLYLSRRSARFFSPQVRLQAWAVWDAMTFALNGLVFVLIGLQLPYVRAGIRGYSTWQLLFYGGSLSLLLIALRVAWMFPGARFAYRVRTKILHQQYPKPSAKQVFVVGWTGMRGVVALAAAMSLPEKLANGSPFPQRNLIIYLTFSVILVTLVLQGLSLPWLIRMLGLAEMGGPNCEEREARRIVAQAALQRLEEARGQDHPELAPVYEDLKQHYEQRLALAGDNGENDPISGHYGRALLLKLELLRTERETALSLRSAGRINDEVLRVLEHEMDLRQSELNLAAEASA
ncbi:MAG: Na+/H+ antiporter [Candidatus Korobacteraceae bacterium]